MEYDPHLVHKRVRCDADNEIDSVHFYRDEASAKRAFERPTPTQGHHAAMLRGGEKTPDGFTRKNPPVTPDGYYRRKDGLVEPDKRTPKGFMRNPKPDEAGTSKSYEDQKRDQSREARYDTKKVLDQVVEKLDHLEIAKEGDRNPRDSRDYRRGRDRRDSRDGRSYYRNDRRDYRGRRDSYDRNRSRGYSRENYGRDRRPSSAYSNGSWSSRSPSRGQDDSRYDRNRYDRYRGRSGKGQRRKEERYYHKDNNQKNDKPKFQFTRKWVAYDKDGNIEGVRSRS